MMTDMKPVKSNNLSKGLQSLFFLNQMITLERQDKYK